MGFGGWRSEATIERGRQDWDRNMLKGRVEEGSRVYSDSFRCYGRLRVSDGSSFKLDTTNLLQTNSADFGLGQCSC